MDVLSEVFEAIQLRGNVCSRRDLAGPWATTLPAFGHAGRFHHVVQGSAWCHVEGEEPLELATGDLIFVLQGALHTLADHPTDDARTLDAACHTVGCRGHAPLPVESGDVHVMNRLVSGTLTFGTDADHPLLRVLPRYVHISQAMRLQRPRLNEVLRMLVEHACSNRPGSSAVVTRLSEIVFIEAVRSVGDEAPGLKAMIKGFSDHRIGRAIALMHDAPSKHRTVSSLAREVGMSRTRFAILFNEMIGTGPMGYLAAWRLQRAVTQLTTTRKTIAEIALANGYRRPAAFTRAFVKRFGRSPRQLRNDGTK